MDDGLKGVRPPPAPAAFVNSTIVDSASRRSPSSDVRNTPIRLPRATNDRSTVDATARRLFSSASASTSIAAPGPASPSDCSSSASTSSSSSVAISTSSRTASTTYDRSAADRSAHASPPPAAADASYSASAYASRKWTNAATSATRRERQRASVAAAAGIASATSAAGSTHTSDRCAALNCRFISRLSVCEKKGRPPSPMYRLMANVGGEAAPSDRKSVV